MIERWLRVMVRLCAGPILFFAAAMPAHAADAAGMDDPMAVVVMRSEETGCGNTCPEWIYARGRINGSTPGQFRKAFKLAGKDDLPVVVNSYGGSVEAAIEVGRMIRQRKASTVVGESVFYQCKPTAKGCKPASVHAGRYKAAHNIYEGYCLSACSFILAGGVKRYSEPGRIGTHQIVTEGSYKRIWYRETYRMVKGKKKIISRKVTRQKTYKLKPTTKLSASLRRTIKRYFLSMGVAESFLPFLDKAPPSGMYLMTEMEMYITRIATTAMPSLPMFRKESCRANYPESFCITLQQS
jgi:hypothetical protein